MSRKFCLSMYTNDFHVVLKITERDEMSEDGDRTVRYAYIMILRLRMGSALPEALVGRVLSSNFSTEYRKVDYNYAQFSSMKGEKLLKLLLEIDYQCTAYDIEKLTGSLSVANAMTIAREATTRAEQTMVTEFYSDVGVPGLRL